MNTPHFLFFFLVFWSAIAGAIAVMEAFVLARRDEPRAILYTFPAAGLFAASALILQYTLTH